MPNKKIWEEITLIDLRVKLKKNEIFYKRYQNKNKKKRIKFKTKNK
jgi:hypothetical protein